MGSAEAESSWTRGEWDVSSASELIPELPKEAQNWLDRLNHEEREPFVRILKDVGPANFARYWREHKAEYETFLHDFWTPPSPNPKVPR
jgi:hypothetical protein